MCRREPNDYSIFYTVMIMICHVPVMYLRRIIIYKRRTHHPSSLPCTREASRFLIDSNRDAPSLLHPLRQTRCATQRQIIIQLKYLIAFNNCHGCFICRTEFNTLSTDLLPPLAFGG